MSDVKRYVPRILRDDGMIEASEVAHYEHLKLIEYVPATALAQAQEAIKAAAWDDKARANKRIEELEAKLAAMEQRYREAVHEDQRTITNFQQQLATATAERDGAEGRRKECERQYQLSMTVKNRQIDDARAEADRLREALRVFQRLTEKAERALTIADWNDEDHKEMWNLVNEAKAALAQAQQQLATAQQELADEKCAYKKLSEQWNRADLELHTAREQQARLREVILWLLGEKGEFPDRPEKVEGKIQPLYWWRTELRKRFEALQATPTGNAFDARAAVVELAEMVMEEVERVDEYGYTLINGEAKYQRAVELKQQAQG